LTPRTSSTSSASARPKKAARQTAEGLPLRGFPTLLDDLSTLCCNTCRLSSQPTQPTFEQLTEATSLQRRTFELLGTVPMYGKGQTS
jgi:hypothetical protein